MQSLWFRAAQAQICTCRGCGHASNMAIRRTTTAVTRPRKSRYSDIFTAFYTTILGTAAVLDARRKDVRRKELDRKIEEKRNSLAQLRESSSLARPNVEPRLRSTGQSRRDEMRPLVPAGAIEMLQSICKMDDALIRHKESGRRLRTFLERIHRRYDPEQKLGSPDYPIMGPTFNAIYEALERERTEDMSFHREPLTIQQFERYHDMINNLVDSLIIQSYYDESPRDPKAARLSLESLDSAWTAIRMLRSEGYPRYSHPDLDPAVTRRAREQLSDMTQKLFDSWDEETRPKYRVAKICYNLLVCAVPPSIHHYNALMLGFTQRGMYNLGDLVADSFLENSRMRPTQQTIVCLLLHYRQKGDLVGFYNMIRRMVAVDNRGMLVRRRWYEDVLRQPKLHKWARQPDVTTSLKENWVIELPTRNQDIYEALVSGLLRFGRIKDAVKVFVASLQERVGVSVELFIHLMRQCLFTLNAPAADILLRGFIDNAAVMVSLILRNNCPRKLAEHLYPLLNMGKPPSWPFSEERASLVWYSKTLISSPEDTRRVRRLTVAMFIRQTENQLYRLNHIVRRMQRIRRDDNIAAREGYVSCALQELNALDRHHRYLAGKLLKHQALLNIARKLETQTWDITPDNIAAMHGRMVRLLERHLPRPAEPGAYKESDHSKEITMLADHWMQYRLSRMHGIRSEAHRLMLDAELALGTGHRLLKGAQRVLFPEAFVGDVQVGFRRLYVGRAEDRVGTCEGEEDEERSAEAAWPASPAVGASL